MAVLFGSALVLGLLALLGAWFFYGRRSRPEDWEADGVTVRRHVVARVLVPVLVAWILLMVTSVTVWQNNGDWGFAINNAVVGLLGGAGLLGFPLFCYGYWRWRVVFGEDEIAAYGLLGRRGYAYKQIKHIDRSSDTIEFEFYDRSKLRLNADLCEVPRAIACLYEHWLPCLNPKRARKLFPEAFEEGSV